MHTGTSTPETSPVEEPSTMTGINSDEVSKLGEGDGEIGSREVSDLGCGWGEGGGGGGEGEGEGAKIMIHLWRVGGLTLRVNPWK